MRRVRPKQQKGQKQDQPVLPLDDGTITSAGDAVTVAMIQALIPLELWAVEEALRAEVTALAGARYAHDDGHPDVVRWGKQPGVNGG